MESHHLRDASVPSSQVQESLSPPLWADPEQPLELLGGKHKHGAPTQKPETERERARQRKKQKGVKRRKMCVCAAHPLMEVRETRGLRRVDTKEW